MGTPTTPRTVLKLSLDNIVSDLRRSFSKELFRCVGRLSETLVVMIASLSPLKFQIVAMWAI